MSKKFVGIAEMVMTRDPGEVIIAANLGSCLGISVYDIEKKVGGVVHCLLPLSKSDPDKAKEKPFMYVDTGVAKLLDMILSEGGKKENLEICVAGGAQINDSSNVFEIGKKNFTILRKILWKNGLLLKAQDVGADYSRTISLDMSDGSVWLKANGDTVKLH